MNSLDHDIFTGDDLPPARLDVGVVIPSLEKYGGAERFLIECVRHWQHRHDITIYAMAFNHTMLKEHGIGNDVRLVELPRGFDGEHSFVTNAAVLPKLWRQAIGRHEVYHTHLWPAHLVDLHPMVWFPHEPLRLLHDLRFDQRSGHVGAQAPHDVHVYPKYSYDQIDSGLYDAYLAAVEAIDRTVIPEFTIANSRYTANYLASVYGRAVPDVVYPGVDAESPIDLKIDQKLFVTISQLWPHKRINLLIEAVALTDEIQLIVIGAGPEQDRLASLCAKLGVEDRVFFLSGLSNFDVRLVLARACAFLFCPIREPFGIVVLEAMAAGKPIVAVNEGGYVELCHPDYAVLVPPSPLVFAEAIQRLRDDPERVRRMGAAARLAVKPYTWERAARELEGFLVKAAYGSGRKAPRVEERSRPLVGIQYYLWYGEGFGAAHWNDNPRSGHVADHPFLGFYASDRGQTIAHHLSQFEAMQLDFVILNLHIDENGPNGVEFQGIQNLFEIARSRKTALKFAIQISPYDDDPARICAAADRIRTHYAGREEYLHLDGKPVLFWFWSSAHDGKRTFFEAVAPTAAHFRNLAFSLRLSRSVEERAATFGLFEGFAPFSPLEIASEENWDRVWRTAYDASAAAGMHYRMVAVSPGYNDKALADPLREGNPYRVVPRRDGATYARSLAFAASLTPCPDLIVVSTYNEYHENTHIEVSSFNGERYVQMTREFVERVVRRAAPGSESDG